MESRWTFSPSATGWDSIVFTWRKGHRLTYFELPGLSEQFARKLFDRSGSPITVLTDPAAIPRESFDAVICFDVLEHVPDPPSMVKSIASYLRPEGMLYVSAVLYVAAMVSDASAEQSALQRKSQDVPRGRPETGRGAIHLVSDRAAKTRR